MLIIIGITDTDADIAIPIWSPTETGPTESHRDGITSYVGNNGLNISSGMNSKKSVKTTCLRVVDILFRQQ